VKIRIVLILTALVTLAVVASAFFLAGHSFLWSHGLAVKEKGLREGEAILVKTRAERFGVQKGDAFGYLLEVWYNPEQVSEIDRASLDKALNLDPFEIRGTKELEFDLDARTKVYRRQYDIQLIAGKVNNLYKFPTAVIRYRPKHSEGLFDKKVVPEPIYVASRLPSSVANLEFGYGPLRPVKGRIEDADQNRLPVILWVLGGFLAALAIADLGLRVLPQWKEMARHGRKVDVLPEAYRSLHKNVAMAVEPRRLLHQMDHVLRTAMARKEKSDWLEEPNLDGVSAGIREPVISLFAKCQKAYEPEAIEQRDVEEPLRQLEEILAFYFGRREVEAWRS
jgi:hypothetical protein